jgi:hypothetical protein
MDMAADSVEEVLAGRPANFSGEGTWVLGRRIARC